MIRFENVNKTYYRADKEFHILYDVSFEVSDGELVAIMGPSGAGKSTIMNIIGLLDMAIEGKYYLRDRLVSGLPDKDLSETRNRSIGFVFQSFYLLPMLTALQNVALPLIYRGVGALERRKMAFDALNKLGISHLATQKPSEMSGGQQQRVACARALVGNPDLILADEPTGALDSKTSQDIMDLLINLNKKEKRTIVIITHDLHVGEQCQRIIYVEDGRIVPKLVE